MPNNHKASTVAGEKGGGRNGGKLRNIAQTFTGKFKTATVVSKFSDLNIATNKAGRDLSGESLRDASVESSSTSISLSTSTTQTSADGDNDDGGPWTEVTKRKRKLVFLDILFVPTGDEQENRRYAATCGQGTVKPGSRAPLKQAKSRRSIQPEDIAADVKFISTKDLYPGVIIAVEYAEECYDPNAASLNSPFAVLYKDDAGQLWVRKPRYFIILNVFAFHLVVVGIYTYGKVGIRNKPVDIQLEHVSLRGKNVKKREFHKQGVHEPLAVSQIKSSELDIHQMSTVHFTKTQSITFDKKVALIGEISKESLNTLEELRRNAGCYPGIAGKPTAPPFQSQGDFGRPPTPLVAPRRREGFRPQNMVFENVKE